MNESNLNFKIGLFFDGTGNNGFNATSIGDYFHEYGNSYISSVTNVYRLFRNHQEASRQDGNKISIYIDGIGTMRGCKDSKISQASGDDFFHGSMGVKAKINFARASIVSEIRNHIFNLSKKNEYSDVFNLKLNIEFDVFGFSRGAALARQFIHEFKEVGIGFIKKSLEYDKSFKSIDVESVDFNFVGLFDTVKSYFGDGFLPEKHPSCIKECAKTVFHITSMHEVREKFPLTSILSRSENQYKNISDSAPDLPGKPNFGTGSNYVRTSSGREYLELCLPGAHSDIGGGYPLMVKENKSLFYNGKISKAKFTPNEFKERMQTSAHWMSLHQGETLNAEKKYCLARADLYSVRENVFGHLQFIYLAIMAKIANSRGCGFEIEKLNMPNDKIISKIKNYEKSLKDWCDAWISSAGNKNYDTKEVLNEINKSLDAGNIMLRENISKYIDEIHEFIHVSFFSCYEKYNDKVLNDSFVLRGSKDDKSGNLGSTMPQVLIPVLIGYEIYRNIDEAMASNDEMNRKIIFDN